MALPLASISKPPHPGGISQHLALGCLTPITLHCYHWLVCTLPWTTDSVEAEIVSVLPLQARNSVKHTVGLYRGLPDVLNMAREEHSGKQWCEMKGEG